MSNDMIRSHLTHCSNFAVLHCSQIESFIIISSAICLTSDRGTNWLTFGVALKGRFKCYRYSRKEAVTMFRLHRYLLYYFSTSISCFFHRSHWSIFYWFFVHFVFLPILHLTLYLFQLSWYHFNKLIVNIPVSLH